MPIYLHGLVSREMGAFLKHFVVWFTVAAVWLGASGIAVVPLPAEAHVAAGDDDAQWLACKAHACGCHTAEMCRASCCCVKRPAPPKPKDCCEQEQETSQVQSPPSSTAVQWRLVIKSVECSGNRALMSLKTASPVPDWRVTPLCLRLPAAAWVEHKCTDNASSHSLPVDPPPPRLG